MVCLDALTKDMRGSERGKGETSTWKNHIKNISGLGIGLGMGYLEDLVKDIRHSVFKLYILPSEDDLALSNFKCALLFLVNC